MISGEKIMLLNNYIDSIAKESSYELNIVSLDEKSNGKYLKKYKINDKNVIGVFENEPFQIEFKNNTLSKVQIRISVDGTDILTGDLANIDATGQMWVVNGYSSIKLKAWPETNKGGAEFLFGKAASSVAANTHGYMESRGIISVAVFKESASYVNHNPLINNSILKNDNFFDYKRNIKVNGVGNYLAPDLYSSCASVNSVTAPGVGAGNFQEQQIEKTAGFLSPKLESIISIKYEWWTSLRSELRKLEAIEQKAAAEIGFPGSTKLIDLGKTPRKGKKSKTSKTSKYMEFERFV
jgi:hypothetical protein